MLCAIHFKHFGASKSDPGSQVDKHKNTKITAFECVSQAHNIETNKFWLKQRVFQNANHKPIPMILGSPLQKARITQMCKNERFAQAKCQFWTSACEAHNNTKPARSKKRSEKSFSSTRDKIQTKSMNKARQEKIWTQLVAPCNEGKWAKIDVYLFFQNKPF